MEPAQSLFISPRCRSRARPGCWSKSHSVEVGGALESIAIYRRVRRAHEQGGTVQRQGSAEEIVRRSVAGDKCVRLTPIAIRFFEEIRFALATVVSDRRDVRSDERAGGIERHRIAEVGICCAVARSELLPLGPGAIGIGEYVGRALTGMAIDTRVIRAS